MKLLKKVFVTLLTALFFISNCILAHAAETNFWSERKKTLQSSAEESKESPQLASLPANLMANPAQILNQIPSPLSQTLSSALSKRIQKDIPKNQAGRMAPILKALSSQYGTVRNILMPSPLAGEGRVRGKIIVHIQDIHLNSEAQGNIGGTVQSLIGAKQVGVIGLEGAFAPINLTAYRGFKDKEATRIVAEYLLRENRISGAVHAALTSPSDIPAVLGVDEQAHYDANVNAYKASLGRKNSDQQKLQALTQKLNLQETSALNPALATFHARVKSYRDGKKSLGEYVKFLSSSPNVSIEDPDIDVFLEAYHMESSLNFAQVESERTALLSQLLTKLNKNETTRLLNTSIAYRLGHINHTDFYSFLKDLCATKKLALSHFKAMDSYIQYVLLTDSINPEKLLPEVARLENQAYDSLIRTSSERNLIRESKRLCLAGKLIEFSLTPDEWKEYVIAMEPEGRLKQSVVQTFESSNQNLQRQIASVAENRSLAMTNLDLSSYEKFYSEAEARNAAITHNLLREMDRNKTSVAVLVTGGFHSPGIDQLMREKGVSVVSFVPKVTKVDAENGSSYLSVFAQEKTPLDQLFKGEKLFVSPPPAELGLVSPLQRAVVEQKATGSPSVEMKGNSGSLIVRFAQDHKIMTVAFVTSIAMATFAKNAVIGAANLLLASPALWTNLGFAGALVLLTLAVLWANNYKPARAFSRAASLIIGVFAFVFSSANAQTTNQPAPIVVHAQPQKEGNAVVVFAEHTVVTHTQSVPAAKASFSVYLNKEYGGTDSVGQNGWYGRSADISQGDSSNILNQKFLRVIVKPSDFLSFSGFHVDIKGRGEFEPSLFGLFVQKEKGKWIVTERWDSSMDPVVGEHAVRDSAATIEEISQEGLIAVTIPVEEIKPGVAARHEAIGQLDLQTGEQEVTLHGLTSVAY